MIEGVPGGKNYCRATFIEILIRLSYHMYSQVHDKKEERNDFEIIKLRQATKMFFDGPLTDYYID